MALIPKTACGSCRIFSTVYNAQMQANRLIGTISRLLRRERHVRRLPDQVSFPKVCLVYPNSYRVASASLGFQVVRRLFAEAGCSVERSYLIDIRQSPEMVGWESGSPLKRYDILAFSVPFELDFPNVPRMLIGAGIPARASERHQDFPLVIGGGAALTINPLPMADFLDAVVLGEAERTIPRLVATYRALHGDRSALLRGLAAQQGIFVPTVHANPDQARAEPPAIGLGDLALSDIVSADSEFADTALLEVGRGCGMGCRFCWAGWACQPLRRYDLRAMLDAVAGLPADVRRIGLVATSHFDHPRFGDLLRGLRDLGKDITLSALRIDQLNEETLRLLHESGTRSISLAPEAGSERLRRAAGKRVSDEQVVEACRLVAASGLSNLKLYYLIGLPGEADSDVEAIAELTSRILDLVGGKLRVSLSVNIFIPKPGTPFAGEPLCDQGALRRRAKRLKKSLSSLPRLSLSMMAPWQAELQALLSRGGREVGELIANGAQEAWDLREIHKAIPRRLLAEYVYLDQTAAGPKRDRT